MARQQLDIAIEDAVSIYRPRRWMLRLWPLALALANVAVLAAVGSFIGDETRESMRTATERMDTDSLFRFINGLFRFINGAFGLLTLFALVLVYFHSLRASFRDPALVLLKDGFVPRPVDHSHALVEWSDVKQIKDHGSWLVRYFVVSFKEPKRLGEIGLRMPWPLGFLPMRFVILTGLHLSKDARQVAQEMRQLMQEAA